MAGKALAVNERIWHGFTRKVNEKLAVWVTKLLGSFKSVGAKIDAVTVTVYSPTKFRACPDYEKILNCLLGVSSSSKPTG